MRIAYRLAEAYKGKLLHVHGIGWLYWDGRRWAEDQTGHNKQGVLDVLRAALTDSLDDTDLRADVRKCESAAGIAGVLDIAAALKPFAATIADLDADPYVLNVANGTLDLHTMELRPHNPADRITKVANAAYDPDAPGDTWEAFLTRVLPDQEVREFLQRYAGVGLAGRVLEHVLAILTGTGRNGKGVFYGALAGALGDYAAVAEPDLFMHREGAHPTGEMDLRGRRWIVVSESDQGRKLAEATVKRLTGGDRIKARRMRQDFVEFEPSHTAALVTNHLPKVSGDDAAIWARLRVVPFDVVIPDAEQDSRLPDKLHLELDAVLTWAITGWQEYQRTGLAEPGAVIAATEHYKADSDTIGRFITECCNTGSGLSSLTESLHQAWATWAVQDGAKPLGKKPFGEALEARGFHASRRSGGVRVRQGIEIKPNTLPVSFDLGDSQ
ncbi:DNA primase family protein [Arthrobacter sp. TMN-50]